MEKTDRIDVADMRSDRERRGPQQAQRPAHATSTRAACAARQAAADRDAGLRLGGPLASFWRTHVHLA